MADKAKTADSSNFDETVLGSGLPVALYFYSDDCLPCINFTRIFNRVAPTLEGMMKFLTVHRQNERKLAERLSVNLSPTVLFFKDGREVCSRLTGYISYTEFRDAVERILGHECRGSGRSVVQSDVLVIGAGPAGLTSSIYTARSRLYTVVVEAGLPGGQVASTFHVANYPGTNGEIRGIDLMENMARQASDFGAQLSDMEVVTEVRLDGDEKHIVTDRKDYYARSVIIATGAEPRKLPVEGEREYRGRGVHYCATCDGAMYSDSDILVVGGGVSALEGALFLTRYAKTVTIINRSDRFKAAGTPVEEILKNPRIKVLYNTVVTGLAGGNFLEGAKLKDNATGNMQELKVDGIFVYIGMQPNSALFADTTLLSDKGYIKTDGMMSTSIPGVFAAGDIRDKEIRQITTAVGDGTIAGIMAEKYLGSKSGKSVPAI